MPMKMFNPAPIFREYPLFLRGLAGEMTEQRTPCHLQVLLLFVPEVLQLEQIRSVRLL